MAVLTFGKPSGVIRDMPDDKKIAEVRAWLANVTLFVDCRIEEMLAEQRELYLHTAELDEA
jgi:hypothetical protein